jgi:Tfp pilus assembly protein FimT
MTVLIVILILTSVAILVYSGYRRAVRTKSTAQQMEALFSTARTLAINQNAHFQAVLDLNLGGLWIDQVDGSGQIVTPKITTPETWSAFVHVLEFTINGAPPQATPARILFRPNGTSDSARIVLKCEGGDSRTTTEALTVKLYSSTARSRTFLGSRP